MSKCKPDCNNITLPTGLQKGPRGDVGPQGNSINWLGTYDEHPNPSPNETPLAELDAYYNDGTGSIDAGSYIYVNGAWEILAKDGDTPDAQDIYNHAILASTEEAEAISISSGGVATFVLPFSSPPTKLFTSGSIIEIKSVFELSGVPVINNPNPLVNPTTVNFDGKISSTSFTSNTRFINHEIQHQDSCIIEIYSRVHINDLSNPNDRTAITTFDGFNSSISSPLTVNKQNRNVYLELPSSPSSTPPPNYSAAVQYEVTLDNQSGNWTYNLTATLISNVVTQTVK